MRDRRRIDRSRCISDPTEEIDKSPERPRRFPLFSPNSSFDVKDFTVVVGSAAIVLSDEDLANTAIDLSLLGLFLTRRPTIGGILLDV